MYVMHHYPMKWELPSGFSVAASARHREDTPTGNLQYIRNSPNKYAIPGAEDIVKSITTSELGLTLRYAPGRNIYQHQATSPTGIIGCSDLYVDSYSRI